MILLRSFAILGLLSLFAACGKTGTEDSAETSPDRLEVSPQPSAVADDPVQTLVGEWKLDIQATKSDAIDRSILDSETASVLLADERNVLWRVEKDRWTLFVNGNPHVRHEGRYTPSERPREGGTLTGSEIAGRPTTIAIEWIEPGHSFWATSLSHPLWPGYRERFHTP